MERKFYGPEIEHAFVAEIARDCWDAVNWFAYADWLNDRGESKPSEAISRVGHAVLSGLANPNLRVLIQEFAESLVNTGPIPIYICIDAERRRRRHWGECHSPASRVAHLLERGAL